MTNLNQTKLAQLKANFATVVKVYLTTGKIDVAFDSQTLITTLNGVEFTPNESLTLNNELGSDPGYRKIMGIINRDPVATQARAAVQELRDLQRSLGEASVAPDVKAEAPKLPQETLNLLKALDIDPNDVHVEIVDGNLEIKFSDDDTDYPICGNGCGCEGDCEEDLDEDYGQDFFEPLKDGETLVHYEDAPKLIQDRVDAWEDFLDILNPVGEYDEAIRLVLSPDSTSIKVEVFLDTDHLSDAEEADLAKLFEMFTDLLQQLDALGQDNPLRGFMLDAALNIMRDMKDKDDNGELDDIDPDSPEGSAMLANLVINSIMNAKK